MLTLKFQHTPQAHRNIELLCVYVVNFFDACMVY